MAHWSHISPTWLKPCSGKYIVGNYSSNINLTFPQTSEKRSLHLIQKSENPC